jgi:DNA-binding transcriptional MerR regulator
VGRSRSAILRAGPGNPRRRRFPTADVAEPNPDQPRRALLKSVQVCDLAKVQPYVLRSWEKEFPDLGVSRSPGGPRFYRRSDVERVLRIKQLVFSEGLTLAGARRRLEEERASDEDVDDLPFDDVSARPVSADARARLDGVKEGLRSLLALLDERGRPSATGSSRGQSGNGAAARAAATEPMLPIGDDGPVADAVVKKDASRKRRASARSASS